MILLDAAALEAAKTRFQPVDLCARELRAAADEAAQLEPPSVLDKARPAPSGDWHDYWSMGPYWWPNPDTADGLPYVRRDGEVNPELNQTDRAALNRLKTEVAALTLSAYYREDTRHREAALRRLETWFLDPKTRMKPHLEYGQGIPGRCDGRGIGIIDTHSLRLLPDFAVLLDDARVTEGVREWCAAYLDWLLTSRLGKDERAEHNNHGTWYDVQVVLLALFCGRTDVAREFLSEAGENRIAKHIAADGSQPHELARTLSFDYSCFNLTGYFDLARMGERLGMDLWSYRTPAGAGLAEALRYLAAQVASGKEWPYPQISPAKFNSLYALLRRAPQSYRDESWTQATEVLETRSESWFEDKLLWPVH